MVKGVVLLSVVVVLGVASCSDDPPVPTVASFCEGACKDAIRCGNGGGFTGCYNGCVNDPRNAGLASVRPEAGLVVGACLSQLDCSALFGNMLDSCWDKARAETAPS